MTNRKGQNSILFIATLGVYLGLVLAGGAAPQVYAHAAVTRNFEIHEEIEVKDDLDKDPGQNANEVSFATHSEHKSVVLANLDSVLKQFRRELPQSFVFTTAEGFDHKLLAALPAPTLSDHFRSTSVKPLGFSGITVTQLPRASIDLQLVTNAI